MSVSSDSEYLSSSEDEETVKVEGFRVLVSQENQVKELFKDHPDLSSNLNVENQQLKNAYMDVLLKQIEILFHSTYLPSWNQLIRADHTLFDLAKVGFEVDWFRQRLDESYVKREKLNMSKVRVKELEKLVKKRKLSLSDLESNLKMEKAAIAAASASASKVATAAKAAAVAKVATESSATAEKAAAATAEKAAAATAAKTKVASSGGDPPLVISAEKDLAVSVAKASATTAKIGTSKS